MRTRVRPATQKGFRQFLLTLGLILSITMSVAQPTSAKTPRSATNYAIFDHQEKEIPEPGLLFRATLSVGTTAQWQRLVDLDIVVLDQGDDWATVLVDDEQLESLARLRFEPQASDELGALLAAQGPERAWLQTSLQPLVDQGTQLSRLLDDKAVAGEAVQSAQSALRASMGSLTVEQRAGLAAVSSVDDDGDGLTNTQEAWWCTDPLNPDSDGDGASDGTEAQAAKDWLANRAPSYSSTGKPFSQWPPQIAGCVDDDQDSVPDLAERWDLGLNMNRESTDRDKFDDGQELFGNTYCPGSGGFCGYGSLPRNEDWGVIFAEMPSWVKIPGNHPLVAAYPVPEVDVVDSSLHVQTVTTVTTDHVIASGTEKSYSTAKTEGTSSSLTDTINWNEWEEVSRTDPIVASLILKGPNFALADPDKAGLAIGASIVTGMAAAIGCGGTVAALISGVGVPLTVGTVPLCALGLAGFGISLGQANQELDDLHKDLLQEQSKPNACFDPTHRSNEQMCSAANGVQVSGDQAKTDRESQETNTQSRAVGGTGTLYRVDEQSQLYSQPLYQSAYPQYFAQPAITQSQGTSWGGARSTSHTEYEEQTVTNGEAFSNEESWGSATAVDSAHAADLWFTYNVRNIGTEYAREIADLAFNIYIGDDPDPAYTYFVPPDIGGDGKFHNFMPGEDHTYTSRHISLTLEQMKAIDLGGPIRIVVEDFSYGIDELFYEDAANAGVLIAMEDGTDDGNEAIDTYLIPTWGEETVLDVLARYFPHDTDADGTMTAIWTPEYRSDTPAWCVEPQVVGSGSQRTLWCKHALSTADWWNIYTNGMGDGSEGLQDTPASPGSVALFRFNKDSDLDGYSDRSEDKLGTDPDDPADYPRPELIAGVHSARTGDHVVATLSLLNTGLYDAYGVEAVMIAPNDSITVTNNTVGGSGRVRAQKQVIVGSRILPQSPLPPAWLATGHALPASGGYYTGIADRSYTFTVQCGNPGGCSVGNDTWWLLWADGAGGNGSLDFGAGYDSPTLQDVGTLGVKLGLLSGAVANGESFTVEARTPRDTFQYDILSEPYTPPVVIVSYNDPQGNHRLAIPSAAMDLGTPSDDLLPFSGQMLPDPGVEIVTTGAFTPGANTTNLEVINPTEITLTDAHLFLEFINISGTVASEVATIAALPPGPSIVPVAWDTTGFDPPYAPDEDYIVMAFLTDYQGNILDTAGRPLSSFQEDPLAEAAVPTLTWDVGTLRWPESFSTLGSLLGSSHTPGVVKQSASYRLLGSAGQPAASPTRSSANYNLASGYWASVRALQTPAVANARRTPLYDNDSPERFPAHSFPLGNVGWQTLRLAPGAPPADISVTQVPSQTVQPGQHTALDVQLATDALGIGPFERTVPLRSNDPAMPEVQLHVTGNVTPASDVVFVYDYQSEVRPLTRVAHVNSVRSAGDLVRFAHGIGGDTSTLQPLILYAGDGSTELGRGAALQPASPVLAQTAGDSSSTDLILTDSTFARRDYEVSYGYEAVLPAGGGQIDYHVPVLKQYYDTVTVDILVHNPAQTTLSLALDIGADGSNEWTFNDDVSATGGRVTADGLAGAINTYLAGQSGSEVAVPMRLTGNTEGTYFLTDLRATPSTNYDLSFAGAVSVSNNAPMETDLVEVCASLVNNGLGSLPAAMVSFFSDDPTVDGYVIGHGFVIGLAAQGGTGQACIDWDTTGFTGPLTLHARADYWNLIAETNESNNTATKSITVLTRPDLEISAITLSDDQPVVGQEITVQATLRNLGQSDAGNQEVAFYLGNPASGGVLLGSQAIASLAGGADTTAILSWTPDQPGPVRLSVVADDGNSVSEYDEGNNQNWKDPYVGFAGPLLLDSGGPADPAYSETLGYGFLTGEASSFCGTEPDQTQRSDGNGLVEYRFDHLLPGHFYHLDLVLYQCDGPSPQRVERVLIDDQVISSDIAIGDGQVHRLSYLLDPAFYRDHSLVIGVEETQGNSAVVSQINLIDVDYRYADAGGVNDPQHAGSQDYGWLDGVARMPWGSLPYQSRRIDEPDSDPADDPDNELRYRFDGLQSDRRYRLDMTFYQGAAGVVQQTVNVDGLDTGVAISLNGVQRQDVSVDVPIGAYAQDGSIVVRIVRTNSSANAFVNEISLEQKTLLTLPVIRDVRVTNVADTSATVSWLTDRPAMGTVSYGATPSLGQVAQDARGASSVGRTHFATLTGLAPSTTYYYAVASADTLDDNGGALYQFTTGPTLPPTAPDQIYGQVFLPDGVTPASDAVVHVTLHDANGQGSSGDAAPLSDVIVALDDGYWNVNLGNARTANNKQPFQYSPAGDQVRLVASDGSECSAEQVVDTANDAPAPAMTLTCPTQMTHSIAVGWNLLGLNVISDPVPTAEDALDDIETQGGNVSEVDRWLNGGWDAHIHNLPFNNYNLEMGKGYFMKSPVASSWQRSGRPPSNPLLLTLTPGWNLVSIPKLTCPLGAEQTLDEIEAQGGNCSEIDRWLNGGWNGHIHNLPFNPFDIGTDEGYFLKCSVASTYLPCQGLVEQVESRLPEPALATEVQPATDPVIDDVRITNRRDVALTVAWLTDQPSDGWVEYGLTPAFDQTAGDERGENWISSVHQVTLADLMPETTYFVRVHSGNSTSDDNGQPIMVATASLSTPQMPFLAFGRVENPDGSPATGALVVVGVNPDDEQNASVHSAVVDSAGYWSLDLPVTDCATVLLSLEAVGTEGGQTSLTVPACDVSPAAAVKFND